MGVVVAVDVMYQNGKWAGLLQARGGGFGVVLRAADVEPLCGRHAEFVVRRMARVVIVSHRIIVVRYCVCVL